MMSLKGVYSFLKCCDIVRESLISILGGKGLTAVAQRQKGDLYSYGQPQNGTILRTRIECKHPSDTQEPQQT